jgi:hypothetical protein
MRAKRVQRVVDGSAIVEFDFDRLPTCTFAQHREQPHVNDHVHMLNRCDEIYVQLN